MIKVLIVDDEFRVCQLICNLIDWGSLDMQIIGVAHNGIEARELARETDARDWSWLNSCGKSTAVSPLLLSAVTQTLNIPDWRFNTV